MIAALVAAAAVLPLPASLAGNSGPFGGVAQAACKSGLTNVYKNWAFEAKVVTNWCYSRGNVTSRRSVPSYRVRNAAYAGGWRKGSSYWTYSSCHSYHGYRTHNCLTRRQFTYHNIYTPWAPHVGICIHTRIYGDGRHSRRITTTC